MSATPATPPARISMAWVVGAGVVLVALVASSVALLSRDHLPVRFVDVEASRLERGPLGSRLHLVLRQSAARGQLRHRIQEGTPRGVPLTVLIETTADRGDDPTEGATGNDADVDTTAAGTQRTLVIDLPDVPRVRVIDRRFGRPESVVFERDP